MRLRKRSQSHSQNWYSEKSSLRLGPTIKNLKIPVSDSVTKLNLGPTDADSYIRWSFFDVINISVSVSPVWFNNCQMIVCSLYLGTCFIFQTNCCGICHQNMRICNKCSYLYSHYGFTALHYSIRLGNMRWQKIWDDRRYEMTVMRWQDIWDGKKYEMTGNIRVQEIWDASKYEITGNMRWKEILNDRKYEMTKTETEKIWNNRNYEMIGDMRLQEIWNDRKYFMTKPMTWRVNMLCQKIWYNMKYNKTWSLVSNSSLSKTFALCSLEFLSSDA